MTMQFDYGLSGSVAIVAMSLAVGETTLGPIDVRSHSKLSLQIGAGLTAVALTLQASSAKDGTFAIVKDAAGNDISVVVGASRVVVLPSGLDGLPWLKLVFGTQQATAAVPVVLMGKS